MKNSVLTAIILVSIALAASCAGPQPRPELSLAPAEDPFTRSIVFLEISAAPWETLQPWKRADTVKIEACATAVGPDLVITTAQAVADAAVIQAKKFGQSAYLPAERLIVDYDINLCLIRINDPDGPPLKPVRFVEACPRGEDLISRWLSSANQISYGRGYLDRAQMLSCPTGFQNTLALVVSSSSKSSSAGELFTHKDRPVGIACWSSGTQVALIPSETINRFLAAARTEPYAGFGAIGFETYPLLDPTVRRWLKMPNDMTDGVYVSRVFSRGAGAGVLRPGDALLAIDGRPINAYGRFEHSLYETLSLEHLVQRRAAGDEIAFTVWRNGQKLDLAAPCQRFESADMLVPYQEYDRQPEYIVTSGCVFQKLSRPYLMLWGDNWPGKTPPHLFHYYRDLALLPSDDRREIVILSFVLPAPVNQGYQQLGRLVVSRCNGQPVRDMESFLDALQNSPDGRFNVIEFEQDNPRLVLPLQNLAAIDQQINALYNIPTPLHIRQ
jgi:hypothetical protein